MTRLIEIVEVGPRDGLQNEATILGVDDKIAFIARLEAAGVKRLEAVSFVNPRRVPQMAGAEEIMAALPPGALKRRSHWPGFEPEGLGALRRGGLRRGQRCGLRQRWLWHPQPGSLHSRTDRHPLRHRRTGPVRRGLRCR